jgi:hypothetical protein
LQYYRLVYSEDREDELPQGTNPILINSYHLDGFDLRSLWKGISINNWNENISLYYNDGEVILDYVPNNLSWLIFSDEAVRIIEKVATEAEVFTVSISSETSKDKIQANVVNILTSISAMNWENSDYVSWDDDPKDIKVIRNLVINSSAIVNKPDVFRLEESKNFIIVSEKFKQEVERNNLKGFGFWEIDIV